MSSFAQNLQFIPLSIRMIDLKKILTVLEMRLPPVISCVSAILGYCVEARHHAADTCPPNLITNILEPTCDARYDEDVATAHTQRNPEIAGNGTSVKPTWNDTSLCVQSYCLYTSPSFNNNRGISVITTPSNLQKLKSLLPKIPSNKQPPSPPPFHVSAVPGKGLGLLASRPLRRGDPIMSQSPVLLVHRAFLESPAPSDHHHSQRLLDSAVDALPDATRSLFLSQLGHFGGRHRVTDILATNSFQTDIGSGEGGGEGHHYDNYPEVSRFNHDCRPNVAFRVDGGLVHWTTAVRDVAAGEELGITYLDSFEPRAARRERALHAWGFKCGCEQCRLFGKEGRESDARLEEIRRLEGLLGDWRAAGVTKEVVARYVELFRKERLEFSVAGAYTLAALNCNMLGEEDMAVEYARLAVEAGRIENGPEARDVREMEALTKEPRGHFSWRKRVQ